MEQKHAKLQLESRSAQVFIPIFNRHLYLTDSTIDWFALIPDTKANGATALLPTEAAKWRQGVVVVVFEKEDYDDGTA